jgi:hypothetical protein
MNVCLELFVPIAAQFCSEHPRGHQGKHKKNPRLCTAATRPLCKGSARRLPLEESGSMSALGHNADEAKAAFEFQLRNQTEGVSVKETSVCIVDDGH